MLRTLEWLTIKQRVYYNTLIMIYKMKNGLLPAYLSEKLSYTRDTHHHNTRAANNFKLPNYTKAITQNSIYYKGVRMFNDLEVEIKNARNVTEFKRLCVPYVRQKF
jgi:hypothetical protein